MTDFILVPASTLSLTDKFMHYTPNAKEEKDFKELLTKVIKSGISDFYRPKCDPSLDSQGKICYQAGLKPAVGQTYYWWEKNAMRFCPERKSRLGTKSEYVAFLGILIKKLVDSGWNIDDAWYAVCNDSKNLGHYWNSEDALYDLEPTGSREVCGFCDLANTWKLLVEEVETGGFWVASGRYRDYGSDIPLAEIIHDLDTTFHYEWNITVGWIVLEK